MSDGAERAYQMEKLGSLMSILPQDLAPEINNEHANFTQQIHNDMMVTYNSFGQINKTQLERVARLMLQDVTRVPRELANMPTNGKAWVFAEVACQLSKQHDQEQQAITQAREARESTSTTAAEKTIQSPPKDVDEVLPLLSPSKIEPKPKPDDVGAEADPFVATPEPITFGVASKPKAFGSSTSAMPFGGATDAMPFTCSTGAVGFGGFSKAESSEGHTKSVKNAEVVEKAKQTTQKVKQVPNYPMRRHKREQRKSFVDCIVKMREEVERGREDAKHRRIEKKKQQADARKTAQESNKRKLELEPASSSFGTANPAIPGGMPLFTAFSIKRRKTLPIERVMSFGRANPLQPKEEVSADMNKAAGHPLVQTGFREPPTVIESDDDLEDGEILADDEPRANNTGRFPTANILRGTRKRVPASQDPALQAYLKDRGRTVQQAEIAKAYEEDKRSYMHRQLTHPS